MGTRPDDDAHFLTPSITLNGLLTFLLFLPLLGALVVLLLPKTAQAAARWVAVTVGLVQVALSGYLLAGFDPALIGYQFTEQTDWITLSLGSLGTVSIDYLVGVDGLNLPLVVLTALVMLVGAVSSFSIHTNQRAYFALYLLLQTSVMGCFLALDFFLFFLFFEFMLLPMYFLIGLWGGARREYAALKFFLYTLLGSVLILLVMIGLYLSVADPVETALSAGLIRSRDAFDEEVLGTVQQLLQTGQLPGAQVVHTFDWRYMTDPANYLPGALLGPGVGVELFGLNARALAFLLLFVGFAIKLPMVPLHTWLPDAHVEAPTPVSVVLAGILLKIGGYGFLRIAYDLFPDAAVAYAPWLGGLGVLSIAYGALNALAQTDLKRLIAYSSVSHMGFVLLGVASLTAEGLNGAIFQMVSHGVLSAMLFLLAGVLSDRTHDRTIKNYRGLASRMPAFAGLTAVAFFASLGLPGFSGFIGELFSLMGGFNSLYLPVWMVVVGALGLVLGAGYFLWTLQRMFFGPFFSRHDSSLLPDLTARERLLLVPLGVLSLVLGVFPNLIFHLTEGWVSDLLKKF
jgi:NADH-quinone oxidoreductase subunit M